MSIKTLFVSSALALGVATAAQATTITVDYDPDVVVTTGGFEFFDVNDDGSGDAFVSISSFSGDARIGGAFDDFADPNSPTGFTLSEGEVLQDNSGNAILLGNGETVNANTAAEKSGIWSSSSALLYSGADTSLGPLGGVGTQGFAAIRVGLFDASGDDGCGGCEGGGGIGPLNGYIYGWLDLTHGSVVVSQAGYGNGFGVTATTPGGNPPVIPLPAGLPLLLAGLGGLAVLKRRKA